MKIGNYYEIETTDGTYTVRLTDVRPYHFSGRTYFHDTDTKSTFPILFRIESVESVKPVSGFPQVEKSLHEITPLKTKFTYPRDTDPTCEFVSTGYAVNGTILVVSLKDNETFFSPKDSKVLESE